MISFPHLNQRLTNVQFIVGHADVRNYEMLVNECNSMAERLKRDLTGLVIDVGGAFAWRRTYEVYEELQRLDAAPRDPVATATDIAQAAREKHWGEYLNDRSFFIELMRRGDISKLAASYLGLGGNDLGPPTSSDAEILRYGGRRPDWIEVAQRINTALGMWHSMSEGDKASIPIVMATRRQEAAGRELAKRMAALEQSKDQQPTEETIT